MQKAHGQGDEEQAAYFPAVMPPGKGLACGTDLVYYNRQMISRITYLMRVPILALYCIYAVSPVYLSSLSGRHDWIVPCGHQDKDISLGIVWVKVLLSEVLPAHQCAQTTATEMTAAEQDREFILVKKKRAVLREGLQCKPKLVQTDGSAPAGAPAKPLLPDTASRHPGGRSDDLLTFCRGGLSPPVPFT